MKTFSRHILVYCDAEIKDDWDGVYCWSEAECVLNWWQPASGAIKIFRAEGWRIGKKKDICPWHNKGIYKKDQQLQLNRENG
jgi:hypothetical protein